MTDIDDQKNIDPDDKSEEEGKTGADTETSPQRTITALDRLLSRLTGGDFKRQVVAVEIAFLISLIGLVILVSVLWVTKISIKVPLSDSVLHVSNLEEKPAWVSGVLDMKQFEKIKAGQKATVSVSSPTGRSALKLVGHVDSVEVDQAKDKAIAFIVLDEPVPKEFESQTQVEYPCKIRIIISEKTIPAFLLEKSRSD